MKKEINIRFILAAVVVAFGILLIVGIVAVVISATSRPQEVEEKLEEEVISEIMAGDGYAIVNGEGRNSDWVELWNQGDQDITLEGAFLSDDMRKYGYARGCGRDCGKNNMLFRRKEYPGSRQMRFS